MKNSLIRIICLFLVVLPNLSHAQTPPCIGQDYEALRAIYLAMDGDNWVNSLGWPDEAYFLFHTTIPPGVNVDDWYGVSVNSGGCVDSINLWDNNLQGTLPPEIGDFLEIESLTLHNSTYDSNWPYAMGDLVTLKYLKLRLNNPINAVMPNSLGNLVELEHLELVGNLQGMEITTTLGFCTNLETFIAIDTNLGGDIPTSFTYLDSLKYLNLGSLGSSNSGNNFLGPLPTNFSDLISLEYIDLRKSGLSGALPAGLDNLQELEYLDLSENNFTGAIPPELGGLDSLTTLKLDGDFSGTLPPELGDLINLTTLELDCGNMVSCFPGSYVNLCTAGGGITGNNLAGSWTIFCGDPEGEGNGRCSDCIGVCPCFETDYQALRALYLSTDGDNWADNTNWPDATALQASPTLPSGFDVSTWYGLDQGFNFDYNGCLTNVDLGNNNLNGTLPSELALAPGVQWSLSTNPLVPNPNNISGCYDAALLALCDANYSFNISSGNNLDAAFTDFCDYGDGACTVNCDPCSCGENDYAALRMFYLLTDGDNWFDNTGWPDEQTFIQNPELPAGEDMNTWLGVTLSADGCVTVLDLFLNNITGNLPAQITDLDSLEILRLPTNNFTGEIPRDIGNLINLQKINLRSNDLSGTIPESIGSLSNLTLLDLYENDLTGFIPKELAGCTNLSTFILEDNDLSGCFETELSSLCSQITNPASWISDGNNFVNSWDDFCQNGDGVCTCLDRDYYALRTMYLEMDGNNWNNTTNWPDSLSFEQNENLPLWEDVSTYHGIITDTDGCVTKIQKLYGGLNGELPGEIKYLEKLEELWLQNNSISGVIPEEMGEIPLLKRVYLSHNNISGRLPASLGNLSQMADFKAVANQLSGPIPPELGNWEELSYLHLNDNMLTGEIPCELFLPPVLVGLQLQDNQLTGSIPTDFVSTLFINLRIQNNQLSGCYDPALSMLCSQLSTIVSNSNFYISDGNSFDVPWEDFCNSNMGVCAVSTAGECICINDLTLNGYILSDTYTANNILSSDGEISYGEIVIFQAGNYVELLSGFEVDPTSTFTAEIDSCQ